MKIQLIKTPTPNTGMPEYSWYMPLNLIWLANYIEQDGHEIEILDGQILSLDEIIKKLNADVVGISFDALCIKEFDIIIKEAKKRNIYTITGGHLATALGEILLTGNKWLDYIICYDGEEAFGKILQHLETGKPTVNVIPNLIYRQGDKIIKNPVKEIDLNSLPIPKRTVGGLNPDVYFRNFQISKQEQGLDFSYNRPINTYSHKGCIFRQNGNGCSFCSRVDKRFRLKNASLVYDEYSYLVNELKADYISDFSDSWIYAPFIRKLHAEYEKRGKINADIRVYGDVRLITEENVKLMKEIGVDTVLLGIESGDERVLKLNGKPIKRQQILNAVRLLAKENIKVSDAYVLGLIGETEESLNNTASLADEIQKNCETEISYWNIMTPLPGNYLWKKMVSDGIIEFNSYADIRNKLNTKVLENLAINHFCYLDGVGYDYILSKRKEFLNFSNIPSCEFVK